MKRYSALLLITLLLPAWIFAAEGPAFESLDKGTQAVLMQEKNRWDQLSAEQKDNLLQRAKRWQSLSESERKEMRKRYENLQAMPPEKRQELNERFDRFRKMSPEKREELRKKWETLSPEERDAMRQKFRDSRGKPGDRQGAHRHNKQADKPSSDLEKGKSPKGEHKPHRHER